MEGVQHSSQDLGKDNAEDPKVEEPRLEFSEDEESLIAKMFSLLGERWDLIAGRIPGRNAEEIKKYWTSKPSSFSSASVVDYIHHDFSNKPKEVVGLDLNLPPPADLN